MSRAYVDTGSGPVVDFDINAKQRRALGMVCRLCPGLCCHRFSFTVRLKDDGTLDRKALAKCGKDRASKANARYAARKFTMLDTYCSTSGTYTCTSLNGNRCGDYRGRPPMCRAYYCASAFFDGHPPTRPCMHMISTASGGPYEGWEPIPATCMTWEREIKPLVDRYFADVPPKSPYAGPLIIDSGAIRSLDEVRMAGVTGCEGSFDYDPRPEPEDRMERHDVVSIEEGL